RAWKPLHELSIDVLGGLGLNYKQGQAHAPGYLVSTWRVWEDLLTVAARLGFGRSVAISQRGFPLGARTKIGTGAMSTLSVFPDCVIEADGSRPRMLLDAKYKSNVEKGRLRISEADIYEALAFAKASASSIVMFAYPALPANQESAVGTCAPFERVEVGSIKIIGVQVEVRGISRSSALRTFADNVANGLREAMQDP
ncbi:MAG: restriction endonuclease, partial [Dokdonella sp.]|nr:restriction endonuclease [Dokdonella sp.]